MIRIIKFFTMSMSIFVIALLSHKVISAKFEHLKAEKQYVSPITAKMRQHQLECLARNIYYEAGYEPFEGKVAVAQVTLNRVESGQFPADVCQVVYQKNIVYEKVLCQFGWYCEQASFKKPVNGVVYAESMEVAKKVLLEGFRLPSVKQALYYHADYVNPRWNRTPIAKIGRHIFYK